MAVDAFNYAADILDPPRWEVRGRPTLGPHQIPPAGDWDTWILLGGRGAGKTEACAQYYATWMRNHPGHRGRIIAPTLGDAVESCIRGPSGLMANDPDVMFHPSAPGGMQVRWPNKSEALLVGTHSPLDVERFRAGGNRHLDWWEEMAACRHLADGWTQAQLGLRLGEHPHAIGSTTPKVRKTLKEILADPTTVMTHGTMRDNPGLTEQWKRKVQKAIKGTRMRQQEIEGILLEDIEGALWKQQWFEDSRVYELPELKEIAIGIDPQAEEGGAETGIIVGGLGVDDHGYIIDDLSLDASPAVWGNRAIGAWRTHDADWLLGEVNNGGDMVKDVLTNALYRLKVEGKVPKQLHLPFKKIRASKGKQTRAQPIAGLTEDGFIHVLGSQPLMEEQCTTWVPTEGDSPDRLDGMVWVMTWCMGLGVRGRGSLRA